MKSNVFFRCLAIENIIERLACYPGVLADADVAPHHGSAPIT